DTGESGLAAQQILNENEFREAVEQYGVGSFRAAMGAEAIKELLHRLDLDELAANLKAELAAGATGQKRVKAIKRLEIVESFRKSNNKPEWMILDVVPVIPPEIRPLIQLDGGRFATSDLNDLYRRVINRNNRLKKLLELGAPDIIVRNEKRMLQEAVDALIDNGRRGRPVTGPGNRPLKSLSDMLRGKQGRFRQNLLGKRVDYSGRSVIVVGPSLKMHQCGLPKEMAIELFKPFVIKRLVELGLAHNIKSAKRLIEKGRPEIWGVLEEVIVNHPVLLNRAPTLHRLGIQAFEPVLVDGRAIKLHPLVCTAFNADFDGDQMPVHVPLSNEAQTEARFLMLASNNILKPADGRPVVVPTQDMIIGVYYLTIEEKKLERLDSYYSNLDEAILAYNTGNLPLHARTNIRMYKEIDGVMRSQIVQITVGRAIFNQAVPQDIGFVDRSDPKNAFVPEIDKLVGKSELGQIIAKCFAKYGSNRTAEVLDEIKALGFKFATRGAITVGVKDAVVPAQKKELIAEAEEKVEKINLRYRRGLVTDEERYRNVIAVWKQTTESVLKVLLESFDDLNPINMMNKSGARGNKDQIRQLAGMRGLMADPSGRTIEIPIKANFREGLTVLDFFISSHGTRKGLADTALRTADSGYLTRRLVDVCQDVFVGEEDCQVTHPSAVTPKGVWVEDIVYEKAVIEPLRSRIKGRVSVDELKNPFTGEVIVHANELISDQQADAIVAAGYTRVQIRSVFTCRCEHGVCAKCYGADMSSNRLVSLGETVGIIAAQSIGEPGTQLTMRTFHTGGVAGTDITQGLPRVEEIFEARKPKVLAVLADISGEVKINNRGKGQYQVTITAPDGDTRIYNTGYNVVPTVVDGQHVEAGDELTPGSLNPHDLLRIKGVQQLQSYLLREVQTVYKRQSVEIGDKHIELIVRQMLRKVRVEDAGDTELLPGEMVDIYRVEAINAKTAAEGGAPATSRRVLLGITKASLATESFLSAASFQETTRVLTDAAIKGKVDPLAGLKENVMIGKLIPAGTGLKRYQDVAIDLPKAAPAEDLSAEAVSDAV
ncbi:MAG: DNA-directed RNA polymerase subunit beta', partial [Clostridiales bacterium]|nr:DNA-directed RNA polymerase subunit beta' [Clostridiales bacterium]